MWIEAKPDQWYETSQGELFKVIAVDNETIEIQYVDGGLEELDLETWQEMDLQATSEPEDFSGAYGGFGRDGLEYDQDFEPGAVETIESLSIEDDGY